MHTDTYTPDPILAFPFRGEAPKTIDDLADRRAQMYTALGAGQSVGALTGLAASPLLHRWLEPRLAPIVGAGAGITAGTLAGAGAFAAQHLLRNARKHEAALAAYDQHNGAPLPFSVRHPYLYGSVAVPAAGAATGATLGALAARALGQPVLLGAGAGVAALGGLGTLAARVKQRQDIEAAFPEFRGVTQKQAQALDPILLHPNLADRADDQVAAAARAARVGTDRLKYTAAGAAAGLLAGTAARFIPGLQRLPVPRDVKGVGMWASLGGGLGLAGPQLVAKLRRHQAAVDTLAAATSEPIPFAVAHPYAANVLPTLAGAAIGAALSERGMRGPGAMIGGGMGAVIAIGPYSRYLQDQRAAFLAPFAHKTAADQVDPRLLHPFLASRPQSVTEAAERRQALLDKVSIGATLGAGAGLLATRTGKVEAIPGLIAGGYFGAVAGSSIRPAAEYIDNLRAHAAALRQHEARTGEHVPFLARHPYLSAIPPVAGAALGFAAAGRAAPMSLRAAGAGIGFAAGAGPSFLLEAQAHRARKETFGGRTPQLSTDRYAVDDAATLFTAEEQRQAEAAADRQ